MPIRAPRWRGSAANGEHGLRRCLEQQVVDDRLVAESDGGDLGWQREDDVEVAYREQVRLALSQPGARRRALALGAVPVAAAVVGDADQAAVVTGVDVPAESGGSTVLDRRHDLELRQAQVPGLSSPVRRARGTEDVGDLEGGAQRRQPPGTCSPILSVPSLSSGLVTARTVRVATRV